MYSFILYFSDRSSAKVEYKRLFPKKALFAKADPRTSI